MSRPIIHLDLSDALGVVPFEEGSSTNVASGIELPRWKTALFKFLEAASIRSDFIVFYSWGYVFALPEVRLASFWAYTTGPAIVDLSRARWGSESPPPGAHLVLCPAESLEVGYDFATPQVLSVRPGEIYIDWFVKASSSN